MRSALAALLLALSAPAPARAQALGGDDWWPSGPVTIIIEPPYPEPPPGGEIDPPLHRDPPEVRNMIRVRSSFDEEIVRSLEEL